jgi:Trk K+ transport system NAD-binding subunit
MKNTLPRLARFSRSIRWAAFGAVFVLTFVALASGVVTSERPDIGSEPWIAWIYYAASLFVFGGVDLGAPTSGPLIGRTLLWAAYLLAPTITTTTVAEAFLKLVRPAWFRRRLNDHMVIVGGGQVGRLYVNAVRSLDPERAILLADDSDLADEFPDAESVQLVGMPPSTLEALQLERASGLVVLTQDDLANLELSWSAQSAHPELRVAVHVSDLALLRPVERAARGTRSPTGFNTHQVTAAYLYQIHLALHFESTEYDDVVVLAGFGRFGQTILELLLAEAEAEVGTVVVVGPNAKAQLRQFQADVGRTRVRVLGIDMDVADPATWNRVDSEIANGGGETPVYVFGGSDELLNLRSALLLRSSSPDPRIFLRCFHRSPFLKSLAKQQGFELLAFETVLSEALREHYHDFFRSERPAVQATASSQGIGT